MKDKLVAMQQQYEQIQRKCQEACKKRSALERFKSFLSSSVKKEDMSAYSEKVWVLILNPSLYETHNR